MKYFCILMLSALVFTGAKPGAAAVKVTQYQVHDFTFKAKVRSNPFDVELRGEFAGPNGAQISIPAFYDGGNIWKIRFSPPSTGRWSLRTVSAVTALNGQAVSDIIVAPNANPAIHGALRIDPANPHHFIYEDGTRYFLMGYEADWLGMVDMNKSGRKTMHLLIDQIASRGFNHVLMNVYAHDTSWAKGKTNEWDYGPPALFMFGGTNEKPDHTRLNVEYFMKFDEAIRALHSKGIVINLMMKVYNKMIQWPAPGSKDEERYFRYIAARYQAFPNITWNFSKEAFYETDKALQGRLIDLVRSADGYHRLTTAHDNDLLDWNPAVSANLDFRTDQEHHLWKETLAFDRQLRPWPILNSEMSYERGVGAKLATYEMQHDWQEVLRRAYEIYLSGGYFAYYYAYSAWDVVRPEPEPPGLTRLQLMKEKLSGLPYWRMEPRPELAIGGPCLAAKGEIYAFYVPANQQVRTFFDSPLGRQLQQTGAMREIAVNLTELKGPAELQWINTWTGESTTGEVYRPGVYQYLRPEGFGEAPALLIVKARGMTEPPVPLKSLK